MLRVKCYGLRVNLLCIGTDEGYQSRDVFPVVANVVRFASVLLSSFVRLSALALIEHDQTQSHFPRLIASQQDVSLH